ncbi:MAG: c-type cytochrome [Myxococcota bacterium]
MSAKWAAFAAVSALSLAGCRGWETEERPVHLIKNMDTQEKGKAYRRDSTGLFADGRMMRLPVEGTVAQGQLGDDLVLEEGLDEAGQPTKAFPAKVNEAWDNHVARGAGRYQIYCAPCHGPALDGKGTVADKALDGGPRLLVAPPDLHQERIAKDMVVGKIYSAIRNGVNAGNMPSYAAQIPVEDRWAIVAYVKSEQMKKDPTVQKEPGGVAVVAVTAASAEAGAQLYKAKGCNACHSIDGNRLVGPSFKGLWGKTEETSAGPVTVDDAYFKESLLQPMAKIVNGYPPAMPPQAVNDLEIQSLALYIQTLK